MRIQVLYITFSSLFIFVFQLSLYSQHKINTYPNFVNQKLTEVLKNDYWKVLTKAEGDLNKDLKSDLVLILESKDSILKTETLNIKPRIILVLINHQSENKVVIQNNKFIARGDEGGMLPYLEPEISIENNTLTIYYQYTRGNQSYSFEYLRDKFVLTHAKSHDVIAATGEYESHIFDFKSKKISSEYGNISEDKNKNFSLKLDVKPKTLSELGKMYEWEVAKNLFL